MNEAFLKWFSAGMIAMVVCSALWLASSAQALHQTSYRPVASYPATQMAAARISLPLAVLPVERAASAAATRSVGVR